MQSSTTYVSSIPFFADTGSKLTFWQIVSQTSYQRRELLDEVDDRLQEQYYPSDRFSTLERRQRQAQGRRRRGPSGGQPPRKGGWKSRIKKWASSPTVRKIAGGMARVAANGVADRYGLPRYE